MRISPEQIPKEISFLYHIFKQNGFRIYPVGGCIRDIYMGRTPNDWDLATDADTPQIKEIAGKNGLFYSDVGEKYGTIVCYVNSIPYEITRFRQDGEYKDGRRPERIKAAGDIYEDLKRRDFTMNAMAFAMDTWTVIDPHGGIKDIKNKTLRAVGNADKRLKEDSLRILRAIRFAVKYGFRMDKELKDAVHANAKALGSISKERITEEVRKMLTGFEPVSESFYEFRDVIGEIMPEIKPCVGFEQNNKYHRNDVYRHSLAVVDNCRTDKFEVRLAALWHDIGKPASYFEDENGKGHFYRHPAVSHEICMKMLNEKTLVLTKKEQKSVLDLVKEHDMGAGMNKKSIKRVLNKYSEDFFRDWLILKQADLDDHLFPEKDDENHPRDVKKAETILEEIISEGMAFRVTDLDVNGAEIMKECGIPAGKEVGEILGELLNEVMDGTLENKKEMLLKEAKNIKERSD